MTRIVCILLAAFLLKGQAPANQRNFVACPIVRDTRTTPCWLGEYKGEMYFLGVQGGVVDDFYPGQLGHEMLVEGTVAGGPRVCGGIPLRPVKLSVMRELTAACNRMLPAEDGIDAPVAPRPPRPGLAPSWVKEDGPQQTTIYFDFDNDFLNFHTTTAIINVANAAKQNSGARIQITGYRGATLLSSGETLREDASISEVRARKVAAVLAGLGVAESAIDVLPAGEAATPDGVNDQFSRRVVLGLKF